MKSILLISHDSVLYGAPRSLLNIIDGLKNKFIFVVITPRQGDLVLELHKRGIKTYISKFDFDAYVLNSFKDIMLIIPKLIRHYWWMFKTIFFISHLNKKYHFDFVHSNSGVVRVGYAASKILGIPHIWHIREFQKEDTGVNFLFGKKHFSKLIYSSDKSIVISRAIMDYFRLEGKSELIYNGVMSIPKDDLIYEKGDYFMYASSLSIQKGIFDVLSAFNKLTKINPTIKLLICGTGHTSVEIEILNYIKNHNLSERIKLYGFRTDVLQMMKKAKACIMASKNEAFGRVTVEAMFMGCPVIGYNAAGTKEIIQSDECGFLYNDIDDLYNKMVLVLDVKTDVKSVIDFAYQKACLSFSQEALCSKMEIIYNT